MDNKCLCGRYARIKFNGEWVCWDCRAKDLRGTHEEDWRDYTLRLKAKEMGLVRADNESEQAYISRSKSLFKQLIGSLDKLIENDKRKQRRAPRTT